MRTITYSDMVNKPAKMKMASNAIANFMDGIYRTFAPRNKYGLTARQTSTALTIAKNGNAGIILAKLYACTGCGIEDEQFSDLIKDYASDLHEKIVPQPHVS